MYRGNLMLEVRTMGHKDKNETGRNDAIRNDGNNEEIDLEEQVVEDEVQEKQEETLQEEKNNVTDQEETVTSLQKENDSLKEEVEKLQDRLLRVQAEFDNYRKRTEKERIAARKYEAQALATELLPVIDNFERALQTEVNDSNKGFYDGVQMVYEQFLQALASQGIEAMEAANKPFDPNLHHAVMQEEDETVESNIITEELQKGYMLKDKVIRPAMVKVNK